MSFKVKDAHWELMVSFMEEHPSLATGRFNGPNGRASVKMLWGELSKKLNALGYGKRSPEKWQKTWTDLKYLLKKKASNSKKVMNATGGGPSTEAPLNAHERRVLQILGDSFYQGTGCPEIAMPSTSTTRTWMEEPDEHNELENNKEHDYSYQPPQKKIKNGRSA